MSNWSLYGLVLIIIYAGLYRFYSINYLGQSTLYQSPITNILFPYATNKMYPTWGYDVNGRIESSPTKHGLNKFYPIEQQGYVPKKQASTGLSPNGGMRKYLPGSNAPVGHWNDVIYNPIHTIQSIYDDSNIPAQTVIDVGHWDNILY